MALLAGLYFFVFKPSADIKDISSNKSDLKEETMLLYNKGKLSEALPGLEEIDGELKRDTEVKTALAFTYRATGKKDESFKKYEEILEYDPKNAGTLLRLGIYYRIDGDLQKSKEYLEEAVNIQPNPQFMEELARTYEVLGQHDKAKLLLIEADKDRARKK